MFDKNVVVIDFGENTLLPLIENLGNVTLQDDVYYAYEPYFGADAFRRKGTPVLHDPNQPSHVIPEHIQKRLTLFTGCIAGMTSASMTHGLDVAKVLRQVGKR